MDTICEKHPILKPLRCFKCMEKWKRNGKKPEEIPRLINVQEIKNGKCPDCGQEFRGYFPF